MKKSVPNKKFLRAIMLVELIIIIAVISILAIVVLAQFNKRGAARGRDAKRVSELNSIRTALQMYYMDHGKYPVSTTPKEDWCAIEGEIKIKKKDGSIKMKRKACKDFVAEIAPYMNEIPADPLFGEGKEPKDKPYVYSYQYASISSGEGYKLHTDLETREPYEIGSFIGRTIAYTSPTYSSGEIDDCVVIKDEGNYILTRDIKNTNKIVCIDIQASNVSLDCQGYLIDGVDKNNSYGIRLYEKEGPDAIGPTDIHIQNCNISDFERGIYQHYDWWKPLVFNSVIENVNISSCYGSGLSISSAMAGEWINGYTIKNVTVSDSGNEIDPEWAFNFQHAKNINIIDCTSNNNKYYGFFMEYVQDSTLDNLKITGTKAGGLGLGGEGLQLSICQGNTISNLVVSENEKEGINLQAVEDSIFQNITIDNNKGGGITLGRYSQNNTFDNMTISNHGYNDNPLYITDGSRYNSFNDLKIFGNEGTGISIKGDLDFGKCIGNVIQNSEVRDSGDGDLYSENFGILLNYLTEETDLIDNTIKDNEGRGIAIFGNNNNVSGNIVCNNAQLPEYDGDVYFSAWSSGNTGDNTCDDLIDEDSNTVTCSLSCP